MSDLNSVNAELDKINLIIKPYLNDLNTSSSAVDKRCTQLVKLKARLEAERDALNDVRKENRLDKKFSRFVKNHKPSISFGEPKEKTDPASEKEAE